MSELKNMQLFGESNADGVIVNKKPFGIDLGTTNSAISVGLDSGDSAIIKLTSGKKTMPSVIKLLGTESDLEDFSKSDFDVVEYKGYFFLVGERAYNAIMDDSVIASAKRYMQDSGVKLDISYKEHSLQLEPKEVGAIVLKGLVQQTGGNYGEVTDVVVTVPAYFNQTGLMNTKDACELAGLGCMNILREPTSAALCYNLDKSGSSVQYAIVFDLGGGTFDVSLIRISERSNYKLICKAYDIDTGDEGKSTGKMIEPQYIDGDGHLGGDDYDEELCKILLRKVEDILKENHPGLSTKSLTKLCRRQLVRQMSLTKLECLYQHQLTVDLEFESGDKLELPVIFNPEDFVNGFMPIYNKAKEKMNNVLQNSNCAVDTIILMGGSTKNPILKNLLESDYPGFKINAGLNPDESVAKGAGIKARNFMYGDSSVQIFDILPQGIGILGAGQIQFLINRNSQLPISNAAIFTTNYDNQDHIDVEIYQGVSVFPDNCVRLGTLHIDNIAPAPAGEPNIGIMLSVNSDCIMTCNVSIDGAKRTLQLDLNTTKDLKTALSAEDKYVSRWRKLAERRPDIREELLAMVDKYPDVYSKEQIADFIKQHVEHIHTR